MAENSKIGWTTHTLNPWIGCQHVSAGCDNCYAEELMDTRYGKVQWGPEGERKRTSPGTWAKARKWNREAEGASERPRVFCASLADVFDNKAPEGAREDLFELIRDTPNLDWLLLTKRPQNMAEMLPDDWVEELPFGGEMVSYRNVWLGVSAENQEEWDRRVPILLDTPAICRFVSAEPLLGPIDAFANGGTADYMPNLVIVGAESGGDRRPMDLDWVRSLRDQCVATNTAFFFKQGSHFKPGQNRVLDGRTWDEIPVV